MIFTDVLKECLAVVLSIIGLNSCRSTKMYYGKINKSLLFCLLFDSKYIQVSTVEKFYVHKHKHYQQYAS